MAQNCASPGCHFVYIDLYRKIHLSIELQCHYNANSKGICPFACLSRHIQCFKKYTALVKNDKPNVI
jgi:hypothetical protein